MADIKMIINNNQNVLNEKIMQESAEFNPDLWSWNTNPKTLPQRPEVMPKWEVITRVWKQEMNI